MAHATGKYATAISDRSGLEFPYNEMVKEWNGSLVHKSEYEPKHPQLERRHHKPDGQSLKNARPSRVEPMTVFLGGAGFFEYNNSMQVSNKKSTVVGLKIGTVTVSTS
jgi:hypothetical protein